MKNTEIRRDAVGVDDVCAAIREPVGPFWGDQCGRGSLADLTLVEVNPLENIDPLADPEKNFVMIVKGGKICKNTIK